MSSDQHDLQENPAIIDDESSISEEMIEFLRNKTFTDDFRSLVNRVVFEGDETASLGEKNSQAEKPSADKADIIRRLQHLFYKTVNISKDVYADYNPLASDNESVYEYSLRYMKETLAESGLKEYALLCYDPAYKSYIPRIYTIENFDPVCMVIAPEDPLYRNTINEAIGVEIDPASPMRESFASKHFVSKFEDSTLFLISVQNILNIFWAFSENRIPHSFIPTSLYPIFVAVIRPGESFDRKEIVKILQQKLSFAFYILHNNLRKDNVPPEFRTPAFLNAMVDTYCRIYGHLDSTKCYIIKHDGLYSSGCYFFINYLWREISSRTGPDSTAVQIEKDRIVLFLSPEDTCRVMDFVENELSSSEAKFVITEVPQFSKANLFDILSK